MDGAPRLHELPPGNVPAGSIPEAIDPYRLLRKLGEGGMGEVWEAEQERPVRRRVALKIVKWGMASGEVLARFESERQALALMSHPSIARIYGAGATTQGRPYFVMELVSGVPVTEYCDRHRLNVRERLELFIRICHGVQHAHQKGVIHRDLKPSNVLVTIEDGQAVPKIIDFGVAKATARRLTERTLFTELGQWIGTPEYMSPEQAEMTGLDVDTRTDVYSLGALLYEILVGTQPFATDELRQAGLDEIRRRIREEEPSRPSTRVTPKKHKWKLPTPKERKRNLSVPPSASRSVTASRRTEPMALERQLRGDLDWITLKALEKDRTRRYGSPAELAADLERHLRHRPVEAGPPSGIYRLGKFVRRHRLGVAAAALVAAALVAATAAAAFGLIRARQETRISLQVSEFLVEMFEALDPAAPNPTTSVREILDRGSERLTRSIEIEPVARARLMATLGAAYRGRGLMREARPLMEEALAIQRRHLGPDHPEVAATLHGLGWILAYTDGNAAAQPLFELALEIREQALGPDHPDVAESLTSLADMILVLRGPDAARPLVERALAIQEAALGPDHVDLVGTLDTQSILLRYSGDAAGSRAVLARALAIQQAALGPDHAEVGWTLQRQGWHRFQDRDLAGAEESLQRALQIHEKTLGSDHITLATDLSRLGHVYWARGHRDAARSYLERALEIRLKGDMPGDTSPAFIMRDLGILLRRIGDDEGARSLLERALAWIEDSHLGGTLSVAQFLEELALLDLRSGDHQQAGSRLERAWELREEAPKARQGIGPARNLHFQARVSAREGKRDQVLKLLRQALEHHDVSRYIIDDPNFADLRGDPGFEALVAKVRRRPEE